MWITVVCQASVNRTPLAGWLLNKDLYFSQFWRLGVWDRGGERRQPAPWGPVRTRLGVADCRLLLGESGAEKAGALVTPSVCVLRRVRLFGTPWTAVCQAHLSMGFPRQEYLAGLPFPPPGNLPGPGIEPVSPSFSCFGRWVPYHRATWEVQDVYLFKILRMPGIHYCQGVKKLRELHQPQLRVCSSGALGGHSSDSSASWKQRVGTVGHCSGWWRTAQLRRAPAWGEGEAAGWEDTCLCSCCLRPWLPCWVTPRRRNEWKVSACMLECPPRARLETPKKTHGTLAATLGPNTS